MQMGAFVYMLLCADDSFYVGSATGDDLTQRIAQHQSGVYPGYTLTRRPVRLVWSSISNASLMPSQRNGRLKVGAESRNKLSQGATGKRFDDLRKDAEDANFK